METIESNNNPIIKETKKVNLDFKLKDILLVWIDLSTLHGYKRIFSTKKTVVKLLWSICCISSLVMSVVITILLIKKFTNYNFATKYEFVQRSSLNFPAITFCNKNPFATHEIFDQVKNTYEYKNYGVLKQNLSSFKYQFKFTDENKLNFFTFFMNSRDGNFSQSNVKLKYEDVIISCFFNRKKCDQKKIDIKYTSYYGYCFIFNFERDEQELYLDRSGPISGLEIEIFTGFTNELSKSSGIHVFVHNRSELPLYSDGFDLRPQSLTNIGLNKVVSKKLPSPYNECRPSIQQNSNGQYKKTICIESCMNKFLSNSCLCFTSVTLYYQYDNQSNIRECSNTSDYLCLFDAYKDFFDGEIRKCQILCPEECDKIYYEIVQTQVSFPTEEYLNQIYESNLRKFEGNNLTRSNVKESILKMNIF
jgi:hypothetical protein